MPEKYEAGDPFEPRVGIGEVFPDIAERSGPQEGVRHCVQEHVRVGMPLESFRMRESDAADDEFPADRHAVDVVAESYAGRMSHGLIGSQSVNPVCSPARPIQSSGSSRGRIGGPP